MNDNSLKDYTEIADEYDLTRYERKHSQFIDSFRHDVFIELAQLNSSMKLLDVGTGTGSGIGFFSPHVKHMTGLDGTQAMLDIAQKKVDEGNIKNVDLVCSNALEIPFEDGSFDIVTSLNFIHLFTPSGIAMQAKFVSEMERVVKKGGAVLIEFDNVRYMSELGNQFGDLTKMSESMKVEQIVGTYMPKTKLVGSISETLGRQFGKLARSSLLKPYAYKWVVKFIKA